MHRQHDTRLLRQQGGGSSVHTSLCPDRRDVTLVPDSLSAGHIPDKLNIVANALSCSQSILHTEWTSRGHFPTGVERVVLLHGGSVSNTVQPSSSAVCLSSAGPGGVGSGCSQCHGRIFWGTHFLLFPFWGGSLGKHERSQQLLSWWLPIGHPNHGSQTWPF